jgi:actinorhodin biosynthesis protein ActVIA
VCVLVALLTLLSAGPLLAQKPTLSTQDYIDIQQLYAKYNDAIDSGDGEAYAATFTPDGVFNTFKGKDALVGFIEQWKTKMNGLTRRHWNDNLIITPTAEGASGSVYLLLIDVSVRPPVIGSAARYTDSLVKTPQGWRFKQRATKGDSAAPPPPK